MTTDNIKPDTRPPTDEMLHLVSVDVDGCLSAGEAQPIDLDVLRYIGQLNDRSRTDPLVPGISFITGRGAEYVEVIIQLTRAYLPAIYECGAAALLPAEYRFVYSPFLDPDAFEHIRRARDLFWSKLGKTKRAYYQPGLELTLSIFPLEPMTMDECRQEIQALYEPNQEQLMVQQARTCIDVLPQGGGKGNGLRWLSELTQLPFSTLAGIGDSPNDLPFLELVAFSGAPANAHPDVKRSVDYVSPYPEAKGVRDFLNQCLAYNQERDAAQSGDAKIGA
jgi:HAD superfamily hydrolase (TIGR01484 family)